MKIQIKDGTTLYCHQRGSGPPLLLMHGGMGWDHSVFLPTFDELEAHATVIYYDHRGNGQSDRSTFEQTAGAFWAEDADALREALGHEKVHLFGHSYGSLIAQQYAIRYPEKLSSLVLCSTTPAFDYPEVLMQEISKRATSTQMEAFQKLLTAPPGSDAELADAWRDIAPIYFFRHEEALERRYCGRIAWSAAAYNFGNAQLPLFNTLGQLGEVTVPTLLIGGKHDVVMPISEGPERMLKLLPRAELEVFDESGHLPFAEEKGKFIGVLRKWLDRHQR